VHFSGVKCTAGLLLHKHKKVYVGIPASCGALPLDEGKKQDGCTAASAPVGAPVHVAGAQHKATLVYDSFTKMQAKGTTGSHKCHFNDLALAQLKKSDAKHASGTIPGTSAPTEVEHDFPASGSAVSFESRSATAGGTSGGGWVLSVNTLESFTKSDVGTSLVQGDELVGMLIVLPSGLVPTGPVMVYNLHDSLHWLHHVHGFHHISLLKAGEHI
jgi:hypothetical protein